MAAECSTGPRGHGASPRISNQFFRCHFARLDQKAEVEAAPAFGHRSHPNGSTVAFDDSLADRQAEAEAGAHIAAGRAHIGFENAQAILSRNPRTLIGN